MTRNIIVYIVIVALLGASLLLGFAEEVFRLDLGNASWATHWATSPVALALGFAFALIFGKTFPDFNKVMSKKLLQYSVIGLGFGMNVNAALASGSEGMMFTIVSVFGTLALGWLFGRKLLKVDSQTSYLLSSGTAICGGSAIAAVGPIIRAKAESMSVALGVVFVLNGIALFVFPYIGDYLGMTMKQAAEGLLSFTGFKNRQQIHVGKKFTILDDSYNASPASMKASLQVFKTLCPGARHIAVLADMKELGENNLAYHREVGEYAGKIGIDMAVTLGEACHSLAEGIHSVSNIPVHEFLDKKELTKWLEKEVREGDCLLFKGSNSIGLFTIAAEFIAKAD